MIQAYETACIMNVSLSVVGYCNVKTKLAVDLSTRGCRSLVSMKLMLSARLLTLCWYQGCR